MVADWSWVSPEASFREQTKISKARGIPEGFSALHEMADQVREQIAIGHPSDRRRKQRRIDLRPREELLRGHREEAVRKEIAVDVEAQWPRIMCKGSRCSGTGVCFEAKPGENGRQRIELGGLHDEVDVDEISCAP